MLALEVGDQRFIISISVLNIATVLLFAAEAIWKGRWKDNVSFDRKELKSLLVGPNLSVIENMQVFERRLREENRSSIVGPAGITMEDLEVSLGITNGAVALIPKPKAKQYENFGV